MDTIVGQLFLQAFIEGIVLAAQAAWQMMLDNPWMFVLLPGMLLLGFFSRRVGRRRRRSF